MQKILLFITILFWASLTIAQATCDAVVETLPELAAACAESDSLCLVESDADGVLIAESLPLTDFESIETQANEEKQSFALIHLPLNDENLLILAYGNTRLENTVSITEIEVFAVRGVNLRQLPSVTASVIGSLAQGQSYTAVGRLEDNTWVQVRLNNRAIGWVSAQFLQTRVGFAELHVISPNTPHYLPMQAFDLSTDDECSALLLMTPQNETIYELAVNGLIVRLNGVAIVQVADKAITVATLAGENSVSAFGFEQIVAENEIVSTALSASARLANIPDEAQIYQGLVLPYALFVQDDTD